MSAPLAAALLLCAQAAFSQQPFQVRRGDIEVKVRVTGTVVADDVIRIKSAVAARVEEISVSTRSWVKAKQTLGTLADKEMAAIRDVQSTTPRGAVEDRWKKIYQPTAIESPGECFLMTAFVKPGQWVKPQALLFEAAKTLRMAGRVRPKDVQWVENGQRLEFWAKKDPTRKMEARISRYALDDQGRSANPGGSFAMNLSRKQYLDPGTEWEGIIIPVTKRDVLTVPTAALIQYDGQTYLPVRVSTGITTDTLTEIEDGVEAKRRILVLDDARLKEAGRHRPVIDLDAVRRRLGEPASEPARLEDKPESAPPPKAEEPRELAEPGVDYGGDPYSQ